MARRRNAPQRSPSESDWVNGSQPDDLLPLLTDQRFQRPLRLFACACLRRAWPLLGESHRQQLEDAEAIAEGRKEPPPPVVWNAGEFVHRMERMFQQTAALISSAFDLMPFLQDAAVRMALGALAGDNAVEAARTAASSVCAMLAVQANQDAFRMMLPSLAGGIPPELEAAMERLVPSSNAEKQVQCGLLRDVIGNPFRPVPIDAAWRSPTVRALAESAYQERQLPAGTLDPIRLGVLADALEDAGCLPELLAHLRDLGPHIRGCHVVEALRGVG